MYKVNKMDRLTINLSQEYDNNANGIQFDYTEWVEKYGDGLITLTHKRRGDAQPYIVSLHAENGIATWNVSDIDTAIKGGGVCQLMYQPYGTDTLVQSALARTIVLGSNYNVDTTPDPYDNWIAELALLAGETQNNAEEAESAANRAHASELESERLKNEVAENKRVVESDIAEAKADIESAINTAKTNISESVRTASESADTASNKAAEAERSANNALADKNATAVIKGEVDALKQQTAQIKSETAGVKAQIEAIKGETAAIQNATQNLKEDTAQIKSEAAEMVNGFDAKVSTAKSEIEAKGDEVIASIPEDYPKLAEEVGNVKKDLQHKAEAEDLATANRKIKALTDVLNGKELAFETTEYNSAKVDVPSGAVADSVLKIGGKSVVMNQLFRRVSKTDIVYGVSRIANADGSFSLRGTVIGQPAYSILSLADIQIRLERDGRKYLFIRNKDFGEWGLNGYGANKGNAFIWSANTGTIWKGYPYAYANEGDSFNVDNIIINIIDLTQMFGSGSEPTLEECQQIFTADYYPYNEGTIISSQTDALEVRGKNLASFDGLVNGEICKKISTNTFIYTKVDNANRFTGFGVISLKSGTYTLSVTDENNVFSAMNFSSNTSAIAGSYLTKKGKVFSKTFTINSDIEQANIRIYADSTVANGTSGVIKVMLEKGSTATTFVPYTLNTITTNLPVLRSAGSVHDERDYKDDKQYTRVGIADESLGANWALGSTTPNGNGISYLTVSPIVGKLDIDGKTPLNIISNIRVGNGFWSSATEDEFWCNGDTLFFRFKTNKTSGITLQDGLARMRELNAVCYYELAEPIITYIDPLPQLEAINVESGGQLTFVDHSELAMPIPTTHEWVVRNEEV